MVNAVGSPQGGFNDLIEQLMANMAQQKGQGTGGSQGGGGSQGAGKSFEEEALEAIQRQFAKERGLGGGGQGAGSGSGGGQIQIPPPQ